MSGCPCCTSWPASTLFLLTTPAIGRSEEHTSELQSLTNLVCRLLLEKKNHRRRREGGEASDRRLPRRRPRHRRRAPTAGRGHTNVITPNARRPPAPSTSRPPRSRPPR